MYEQFMSWVDVDKWNDICSQAYNAKVLNKSSNRMTKEKWIINGLRRSNHKNNINFDDCYDYDVLFNEWTLGKVEIKTGNHPMFSAKQCKPKEIVKLKLKNIYESLYDRETLDKNFDHLMIINLAPVFCVAFCDYATANKHLVQLKDGFLTKIPLEELTIVYKEPMKFTESKIDFDPNSVILRQLEEAGY